MRRRVVADAVLLIVLVALVAARIVAISRSPRIPTDARVAQLMLNRSLANQVIDYARQQHRPAFFLDSVRAHLDGAHARVFDRLRTDLWGDDVGYYWEYCWFSLFSDAGHRGLRPGMDTTFRPFRPNGAALDEVYPWPAVATQGRDCPVGR